MATNISLVLFFCIGMLASPAFAFGAGEVPDSSQWDGFVWRHGDIEKVLLVLPVSFITRYAFTKMQARQVYFGNWLRDYSQLLDVAGLKVAHESVLRGVISVLGFMEFGLATNEFDVTKERLGVYRHEQHIDNPYKYAEDLPGRDASQIDPRLRGPVQPEELEIDPNSGMKNYIANSGQSWITAADYIREQLQHCINHGRNGNRNEAFIHLGAAMHTLEDFAAHSNYTELCLHALGETEVFAFVGDDAKVVVHDTGEWVPPLTTGTFGALDILHSFLGEADDKIAVLNEGEEDIPGTSDFDVLSNKLTPGGMTFDQIFTVLRNTVGQLARLSSAGDRIMGQIDAVEAVAQEASNNPAKFDPNDNSEPMPDLWNTIEPVFELHDDIQRWLMENEGLFRVPILADAVDNIGNYMSALVYKFLALLLEPSLQEARNAVKGAKDEAFNAGTLSDIFQDGSTDTNPSHSDIAKDHFSNLLNQPAGLVATVITNWSVQQVVRCWDDPSHDADTAISDILKVLHHPAFAVEKTEVQQYMFSAVEAWWGGHDDHQRAELRQKLSKESAKSYYDHHDHTVTAADFRGPNKRQYKQGYDGFPGARPELVDPPPTTIAGQVGELVKNVSEKLNEAGEAVVGGAVEAINVVGDTANQIGNGIAEGAEAVGSTLVGGLETAGNAINSIMPWNW